MRSRLRRIKVGGSREDAPPVLEPLPARPGRDRRFLELVLGQTRSPRLKYAVVALLSCAAILVVLVPLALWAGYRITHVLSRNAIVKGTITQVGTQLSGVVANVEVDAGQRVRAGQILARFEDHQLQANVSRARSRLDTASRGLEVEQLAIEQEHRRLGGVISEATARSAAAGAQVEAAQSQADDAKAWYEQRKSLAEVGVIAQEEVRNAETRRRTATALEASASADRKAAEAAERLAVLESTGLDVRRRHLAVLQAEVAAFRAELTLAEADLRAAVIRAPADGWVVRRIAEPGSSVVVGQPIVALWIGKEVWVEAWIEEDDLAKVAAGCAARVTVKPYPSRVFTGVVESVGVSTDYELPDAAVPQPRNARMRATPVVCVRIRLDQSSGLFPGLSAVVGIHKKRR